MAFRIQMTGLNEGFDIGLDGTQEFDFETAETVRIIEKDYEELDNLPKINGHTLIGDKTSAELEIAAELEPATTDRLGGIIVGSNLSATEEGVLSVTTADDFQGDNTRPMTAAGVNAIVGNINVILGTI